MGRLAGEWERRETVGDVVGIGRGRVDVVAAGEKRWESEDCTGTGCRE
jgi:hypothetical protein